MSTLRICIAILLLGLLGASSFGAGPKLHYVTVGTMRGEPAIEEGKTTGYFIWVDKHGLHVRWTTDGKPLLFTGRLDTDKPVAEVKRVVEDGSGWAKLHGKRVVLFSATSRGELDGFDLRIPGGHRVRMELHIDGVEPEVEKVKLGAKGNQPKGFPLSVSLR